MQTFSSVVETPASMVERLREEGPKKSPRCILFCSLYYYHSCKNKTCGKKIISIIITKEKKEYIIAAN